MAIGTLGVEPKDEVMLNLRSGGEQIIDGRPSASCVPNNKTKPELDITQLATTNNNVTHAAMTALNCHVANSGKESNLIFSESSPSVITNRPRCNNLRSFSLFSCQGARYAAAKCIPVKRGSIPPRHRNTQRVSEGA